MIGWECTKCGQVWNPAIPRCNCSSPISYPDEVYLEQEEYIDLLLKSKAYERVHQLACKLESLGNQDRLPVEMRATFTAISEEIRDALNGEQS